MLPLADYRFNSRNSCFQQSSLPVFQLLVGAQPWTLYFFLFTNICVFAFKGGGGLPLGIPKEPLRGGSDPGTGGTVQSSSFVTVGHVWTQRGMFSNKTFLPTECLFRVTP